MTDKPVKDKTYHRAEIITCPKCQEPLHIGKMICPNCQAFISRAFKEEARTPEQQDRKNWSLGEVAVADKGSIILEIDGKSLKLSIKDEAILGRNGDVEGEERPTVDLTPYKARENGVSRLHLKITRKEEFLYVTDLGSMNGTLLNGRKLFAHSERIIRHGDELCLGYLKMKVQFP